jgi:hypothetical protein
MSAMVDERRGWHPDPFGLHEFRFFSDDGSATLLVRDGGANSYDKPPADGVYAQTRVETPLLTEAPFVAASEAPAPIAPRAPEPRLAAPDVIRSLRAANPDARMRPQKPLRSPDPVRAPGPMLSKPAKVAYIVVLVAMAASGVALIAIHLRGHGHPTATAATTTTTKPVTATSGGPTTTAPLPSALQPSAAVAATRFIGSWAAGNQAEASTVATASAVSTLFAGRYSAGLVISRGCSDAFTIVCTYGPPGGADPTDPVYQIHVVKAPAGWYVASVVIDN